MSIPGFVCFWVVLWIGIGVNVVVGCQWWIQQVPWWGFALSAMFLNPLLGAILWDVWRTERRR